MQPIWSSLILSIFSSILIDTHEENKEYPIHLDTKKGGPYQACNPFKTSFSFLVCFNKALKKKTLKSYGKFHYVNLTA